MDARVAVVGGGLGGLFAVAALLEQGVDDVVLLERASVLGGVARTIRKDGFELEPAAGTLLLPKPDLSALLDVLGVRVERSPANADGRFVVIDRELIEIPASPKALFSPVMGVGAKLRAGLEPFIRSAPTSSDESLEEFLTRRLGQGAGRLFAWLGASGVFAGDPTRLSAAAAFPLFPELESEAGSIVRGAIGRRRSSGERSERPRSHVPVGGMSAIADAVAEQLGDRVRTGWEARSIRQEEDSWVIEGRERLRVGDVVVATPRSTAGRLLGGEFATCLGRGVGEPTAVVGMGWTAGAASIPNGFGALVGPDEGLLTRGILFESSYAPSRAPVGSSFVKVIAGGPGVRRLPEDDGPLLTVVRDEVTQVLGVTEAPRVEMLVRHPHGVPQYTVGHRDWLAGLDRLSATAPGLHLAGWDYRGVGVAHLATDARRIAAGITSGASHPGSLAP